MLSAPWALLHAGQGPQPPRVRRTAQMLQRLTLDLTYALARQTKILRDLFQRVLALEADAKAHPDHFLFAGRQRLQHIRGLGTDIFVKYSVRQRSHSSILKQIA